MRRPRALALAIAGLGALAATVWLTRPQPCDIGVDGALGLAVWPGNVLARLTGGTQDCDPWSRLPVPAISTPFEVHWSINAYAGPAGTNALFHPDGRVEVWDDDFLADDGGRSTALTVRDPALYRLAVDLLGPLRGWSQPSVWDELGLERVPYSPLACASQTYHAGLTVHWSGSLAEPREPLDLSYITTDALDDTCPAQAAMGQRHHRLMAAVRARLPQARAPT